ncbi:MAG: hypothetical protein JRI71_17350, partial [Deltaproteobacteria bacterium]|nr:hypothetical protein [Deltaproteobacteria bacterium]
MPYLKGYKTKRGTKYIIIDRGKAVVNLGYCTATEARAELRRLENAIHEIRKNRRLG